MIWLAVSSGALALSFILLNVQPAWLQPVAFALSLSLFATYLLQGATSDNPGQIRNWLQKRVVFLATLTLLVVISFLARRYEVVYDFSQYKEYSLRDETKKWLSKIEKPVNIFVFLQSDNKTNGTVEWLKKQIDAQQSHVQIAMKNINRDVLEAKKYGINKNGQAVLASEDNWIKVDSLRESSLVPGLMKLLSRNEAPLCFLIGHGEPDIMDTPGYGLNQLGEFYKNVGYRLKAVSLDQNKAEKLEADCRALLIISPHTEFLTVENEELTRLAQRQILPLFMAIDPPTPKAVQDLLISEGLNPTSHVVINKENLNQNFPVTDIVLFPASDVIGMLGRYDGKIYLPKVQNLEIAATSASPDLAWQPFLMTPPAQKFTLADDENQGGAFIVAARAYSKTGKPLRLVLGSGGGLQANHINYGENQRMMLAVVSWLTGEEGMTWVNERNKEEMYLTLTPNETLWIKNFNLYLLPGSVLILTFSFWLQRRLRS